MKIWVTQRKIRDIVIEVNAKTLEEAKEKADDGVYDVRFLNEELKGNYGTEYTYKVERKKENG